MMKMFVAVLYIIIGSHLKIDLNIAEEANFVMLLKLQTASTLCSKNITLSTTVICDGRNKYGCNLFFC